MDVNAVDKEHTALHIAAEEGHDDVAKVLPKRRGRKCCRKYKWTALHVAAENGHADFAKVLIQNGADVNAVEGNDEWTALHLAAQDGSADIAKVLLQNGADVNAVEEHNWTALIIAGGKGHIACILYMLWGHISSQNLTRHNGISFTGFN